MKNSVVSTGLKLFGVVLALAIISLPIQAATKPNILAIWGDDIGPFNISAYNRGIMGYKTPNIDRIANEGILFTDSYGDQVVRRVVPVLLLVSTQFVLV